MTAAKLVRDIVSVFAAKIFVLFIALATMVLIARALGAEGRGSLALLLVIPQLMVSIFEGGMRQASIVFIGKKKFPRDKILGAVILYVIFSSVIGYSVTLGLMLISNDDFELLLIFVAASMLPFTLYVNSIQGLLLGDERISDFNKVLWHSKLLYFLLLLLLFYLDSLTVFSATICTVIAAIYNAIQGYRYLLGPSINVSYDTRFTWTMLKLGISYAIAMFLIQANYKLDILLLGWLSAKNEIGEYVVAVQFGELLWQFPAAVVVVMISRTANSKDNSLEMIGSIVKTCRVTFFVTLLSAIVLLIGVGLFAELILGKDFSRVFPILLSLSAGLVVATLFKSINSYFAGVGNPLVATKVMGASVILNIILNFILIPIYGAFGAGIASTVSYIISASMIVSIFCKKFKIPFKEILLIQKEDFKFLKT